MAPLMALLALVAPCKKESPVLAGLQGSCPGTAYFLVSVSLNCCCVTAGMDGWPQECCVLLGAPSSLGDPSLHPLPAQSLDSQKGTASSSPVPQLSSEALHRPAPL